MQNKKFYESCSTAKNLSFKMDSLSKLKKWLKKTKGDNNKTSSDLSESDNDTNETTSHLKQSLKNLINIKYPIKFDKNNQFKLFENNCLIIYVQKTSHQRKTRFNLQDSLFKIKILTKDNVKNPLLLKDLLEVFEVAFKFILKNIKTFFQSENHHIAYLTLIQEPMINGINTGKKC